MTLAALDGAITSQTPAPASSPHVLFEPNVGQWPSDVLFEARTRAGRVECLEDGFRLIRRSKRGTEAVTLKLEGASSSPGVKILEGSECRINRYMGADPRQWFEGIPTSLRIRFLDIYPGIDMELRGDGGVLAFDFRLAAGALSSQIRLRVDGEGVTTRLVDGRLRVTRNGFDLFAVTPPFSFQPDGSRNRRVGSRIVPLASSLFGFETTGRDPALPLIIDPLLPIFVTFSGGAGSSGDFGRSVDMDDLGNVYAGSNDGSGAQFFSGSVVQSTFGAPAPSEMLIVKYSPAGSAIWATHVGGAGLDNVTGVAAVRGAAVFVMGDTMSTNFPTLNTLIPGRPPTSPRHLVLLKLNDTNGTVLSSSVFGGTASDSGGRITADTTGSTVYFTGTTQSTDLFPSVVPGLFASAGGNDAFVGSVSFTSGAAKWRYGTYFGGAAGDGGNDVALDSRGNVLVVGNTSSSSLPSSTFSGGFINQVPGGFVSNGAQDAFVAGFSFSGSTLTLDFSTFFGGGTAPVHAGSPIDTGWGVALDKTGREIVLVGDTVSTDLPTTTGAFQPTLAATNPQTLDGFMASFHLQRSSGASPHVLSLNWATYLGGTSNDTVRAAGIGPVGNIVVGGSTASAGFPTLNAPQMVYGGGVFDTFLAKFSSSGGTLYWSTFWGGNDNDVIKDIALRPDGTAVCGIGSSIVPMNVAATYPVGPGEQLVYGGAPSDAILVTMGEPDIDVTPLTVRMNTAAGTTVESQVSIRNLGTTTLNVNAIPAGPVSTGSPFIVPQAVPAVALPPGGVQNVTLRFSPTTSASTFTDLLNITSDDRDEATVTVTLEGKS